MTDEQRSIHEEFAVNLVFRTTIRLEKALTRKYFNYETEDWR